MPNLTKAFFALGGAEAIENAIKLARIYTGRHKIVSLYLSFHGASYGAMSVGGGPPANLPSIARSCPAWCASKPPTPTAALPLAQRYPRGVHPARR